MGTKTSLALIAAFALIFGSYNALAQPAGLTTFDKIKVNSCIGCALSPVGSSVYTASINGQAALAAGANSGTLVLTIDPHALPTTLDLGTRYRTTCTVIYKHADAPTADYIINRENRGGFATATEIGIQVKNIGAGAGSGTWDANCIIIDTLG